MFMFVKERWRRDWNPEERDGIFFEASAFGEVAVPQPNHHCTCTDPIRHISLDKEASLEIAEILNVRPDPSPYIRTFAS